MLLNSYARRPVFVAISTAREMMTRVYPSVNGWMASSCGACEVMSPIVKSVSQRWKLTVRAVSTDGGPSPHFPKYTVETGQRAKMGLEPKIKPAVHRTVAKSMALIETTDGFFSEATRELNSGPLDENKIVERLDGLYKSFTGIEAHNQKSSLIIWDEFEDLASDALIAEIQDQVVNSADYAFLSDRIQEQYSKHALYQQSIVLFLYWMLSNRKRRLLKDWPVSREILETLASDVSVSLLDAR